MNKCRLLRIKHTFNFWEIRALIRDKWWNRASWFSHSSSTIRTLSWLTLLTKGISIFHLCLVALIPQWMSKEPHQSMIFSKWTWIARYWAEISIKQTLTLRKKKNHRNFELRRNPERFRLMKPQLSRVRRKRRNLSLSKVVMRNTSMIKKGKEISKGIQLW